MLQTLHIILNPTLFYNILCLKIFKIKPKFRREKMSGILSCYKQNYMKLCLALQEKLHDFFLLLKIKLLKIAEYL